MLNDMSLIMITENASLNLLSKMRVMRMMFNKEMFFFFHKNGFIQIFVFVVIKPKTNCDYATKMDENRGANKVTISIDIDVCS